MLACTLAARLPAIGHDLPGSALAKAVGIDFRTVQHITFGGKPCASLSAGLQPEAIKRCRTHPMHNVTRHDDDVGHASLAGCPLLNACWTTMLDEPRLLAVSEWPCVSLVLHPPVRVHSVIQPSRAHYTVVKLAQRVSSWFGAWTVQLERGELSTASCLTGVSLPR